MVVVVGPLVAVVLFAVVEVLHLFELGVDLFAGVVASFFYLPFRGSGD